MQLLFILLFTAYLFLFGYILMQSTWVKASGISKSMIAGLWVIKAIAGVLVVWLHNHYYQHNDYEALNQLGIMEFNHLRNQPFVFFTDWLHSPYADKYGGFFNSVGSYWNDLRNTLLSKLIALFNIINRGNIYANTILFAAFSMIGHLALFRVFHHLFPKKKIPVIIGCFLLPSTLMFSSGLHKDAVVFAFMGLFFYAFYFAMAEQWNNRRALLLIISVIGLLLMRNYMVMILLPIGTVWYVTYRKKWNAPLLIGSLLLLVTITLIVTDLYFPSVSPVNILAQKQADYLQLPSTSSALSLQPMEASFKGFILGLPQAAEHAFLKPFLWDEGGTMMMISATELFLYHTVFVLLIFLHHRSHQTHSVGSIGFICLMAIFLLMFAGFISPNVGTLVRYRSLYLPLVITPLFAFINWRRILSRN